VEEQSLNLERNKAEKDLYYEYVESYKKVIEYIPKVKKQIKDLNIEYKNINQEDNDRLENIKIKINQKVKERNVLYSAESDLMYVIIWLERYLPYEERYYSRKYNEEQRKLTYNKASNVGIIFKEKISVKEIEKIVHNKLLQKELLYMLKDLLTDKQYTCVFMYFFEGYTQEHIADKLKIERPTVTQYIQNSIEKIRMSEYFLNILNNFI
jgi:predicted DNA-binding protein YlxM (UPF0122 family)